MPELLEPARRFGVMLIALVLVASATVVSGGTIRAQSAWDCADFPFAAPAADAAATPDDASGDPEVVPFPEDAGEVLIFAASSLTDVFGAIESDLEAANPGLDIVYNFAGSQALATQLAEGAPADVFASANNTQMAAAVDAGVIDGEPVEFANNRLAIVVPADNPAGIDSYDDLAGDNVQVVLAAENVPVGGYSRSSICGAEAAGIGGEGFAAAVANNVVSNESNVRNVLAKVELGEADAGIVYETDITDDVADAVTVIEIPTELNVIASYPIAAVADGNSAAADAFISYLLGPDGQARLAEFGFS